MLDNPLNMTGRTILVSGASSGLGRGIAQVLAGLGARVVVHGRDLPRINETLATLPGAGHIGTVFDLANYDGIGEWVADLVGEVGALDGIVHSAGILTVAPVKVLSSRILGSMTDVNVHAAISLARALRVPAHRTSQASIVFISSVMAFAGTAGQVAYSATKGALVALTRSMAMEFAKEGIRVNCIAPGAVQTEMVFKYKRTVPVDQMKALEARHPLGFGTPEDIGYAAAYLMARTGKWITGSTLVVDGGYLAQ
ncbi:MAG: SDR family oxidoreductase [Proteobacteria bacterium]|nr:SDR family oxidoreductase [Pseudomonadota bacterium]